MLSLKNFRNVSEEELALRRIVSLLLEKIGSSSVKADFAEHETFRAEMDQLRERVDLEFSAALLFVTTGSAIQAMEIYNLRITEFMREQAAELQCIVAMIAETAIRLGGANSRAAQSLKEIGNRFEQAGALEDLHALKGHLGDCLKSFREEVERQKAESDAAIRSLRREVGRRPALPRAAVTEDYDPVTGLPGQAAGLRAMQTASETGKRTFVVAMVVKGVQSVNARFGFGVGDRMLYVFRDTIGKRLSRGIPCSVGTDP